MKSRRRRLALAPLVLATWISACSDSNPGAGALPRSYHVTEHGDVTVVRNSGPQFPTPRRSVHTIWSLEGDPIVESEWGLPARIHYSDGRLFVLDPLARRVYTVSTEGVLIGTFGEAGAGPGEFLDPVGIATIGDRIAVADRRKGAVDLFGRTGEYATSIRADGPIMEFFIHADSLMVVSALGAPRKIRHPTNDGERILEPPESWVIDDGESECTRLGSAGGFIVQSSCVHTHLRLLESDGRVVREILGPDRPEALTAADRERLEKTIRSHLSEVPLTPAEVEVLMDRAFEQHRIKRRIQAVRWDRGLGLYAVWEQAPEELGGSEAGLHLFSGDGVYLAELEFSRQWKDIDLHDGRVYALEEDPETGLVYVTAYALDLPWSEVPVPP